MSPTATLTAEIVWRAQPRQAKFLLTTEDEMLYGGAAGGGKSDALLIHQIQRRTQYAGSKGLYLRKRYSDLSKAGAAIDRSKELLSGVASWHEQTHRWRFPNRSVFEFGNLDTEQDKYAYQSAQYDDISFDELTQFTESQYLYMLSRCRATIDGIHPQMRSATNPGNVGHGWVQKRWIKNHPPEIPFDMPLLPGQTLRRRGIFIPARLQDNQILMQRDPGYWDRLMALPEAERKALAYGDWDAFAGQYFTEWLYERHVIEPFSPPARWRRWGGFDWGFAKPLSFGLYCQDPDTGRIFRFRELYQAGLHDGEAIERIKGIIGNEQCDGVHADPSMWAKKSDGTVSTAEKYVQAGIPLVPANNDRLNGWRHVRNLLADGRDGKPMFQVTSNCLSFIDTIPGLVFDERKPEDLNTDGEDHAADEWRYALMARRATPAKPAKPQRQKAAWEYLR